MNHLLKSKANVCKTRARVLGYKLEVIDCQADLVLLLNGEKIAALGMRLLEGGEEAKFESFMIDVRKWMWAEAEGFTVVQMVEPDSELRDSIFRPVSFSDLPRLLK